MHGAAGEGARAGARAAPAPLPRDGSLRRIAVFRALQLGDLLCAVPALRALRAAFPQARITFVGLPWAEHFAARFRRYVDDFIPFPGAPGLPERRSTAAETAELLGRARARRFDLALQLHGTGEYSNAVVATFGARVCAGFHPPGASPPDPSRFIEYPDTEPEIRRLLRLLAFLGVPDQGESLEFPIAPEEWRECARLRAHLGLHVGKYVCVHAGARAPARRWPVGRFARVADRLAGKGLQVALTGTAEEAGLTAAIARAMLAPSADLAGQAATGVLAALFAGARLLICNDTGVSHVAAALNLPSVVVFTGSSPPRWAPLDHARHRPVFHAVDCRPCSHWTCPIGHPCARNVFPEDVMREVEVLLNGGSC